MLWLLTGKGEDRSDTPCVSEGDVAVCTLSRPTMELAETSISGNWPRRIEKPKERGGGKINKVLDSVAALSVLCAVMCGTSIPAT